MIDISGLDKKKVLMALYDAAKPQGLGFLHFSVEPMTEEDAATLLGKDTYFDYVNGRVMKVDLTYDNHFDERLYDRDNGEGAAAKAVERVRNGVFG